jgi:hypothetical protein
MGARHAAVRMAMITLELDKEEAALLDGYIRKELDELHTEIAHTDSKDFRDYLKEVRQMLERLLARLEAIR